MIDWKVSWWNVMQNGNSALHIASLAGRLTVVDTLIEHGANVNTQNRVS